MKLLYFLFLLTPFLISAQNWEELPNFPGDARDDGVAFTLLGKGYCVTGKTDNNNTTNTLYVYDPVTKKWEPGSSFPGKGRQYASVFTTRETAYLIGGYSLNGEALKDVWQYDARSDTWVQKQDFPDSARWSTVAFSSGEFGYFGLGASLSGLKKDFWKYLPEKDTWIQLEDFPGEARRDAIAVSIQGKAVVGLGLKSFDLNGHFEDLYRFDVIQQTWTQLNNFPGGKLSYAFADKIGTKLIVGGGMKGDQNFQSKVYQYDGLTQNWIQLDSLLAGPMRGCSHFVIANDFYLCTGLTASFTRSKLFHRLQFTSQEFMVYPNPVQQQLYFTASADKLPLAIKFFNLQGKLIYEANTADNYLLLPPLNAGVYICRFTKNNTLLHTEKLVIQ